MTQPHNGLADALERLVPEYDALVADARLGARNAPHYHELEERAQSIAARMVAAFRGGSTNPNYDSRSPVPHKRTRSGGIMV